MSTALVEAPTSPSLYPAPTQLTFSFEENASVYETEPAEPVEPSRVSAPECQHSSVTLPVEITREDRLGKPVKLGGVMLQLLRSYGITEEEIAEGLENYARKTGVGLAS